MTKFPEKRYNEDEKEAKEEREEGEMQTLPVKEETVPNTKRSLSSLIMNAKKPKIDTTKHWLLDSSRFNLCVQKLQ